MLLVVMHVFVLPYAVDWVSNIQYLSLAPSGQVMGWPFGLPVQPPGTPQHDFRSLKTCGQKPLALWLNIRLFRTVCQVCVVIGALLSVSLYPVAIIFQFYNCDISRLQQNIVSRKYSPLILDSCFCLTGLCFLLKRVIFNHVVTFTVLV